MMNLNSQLIDFIADTKFGHLGAEEVEATKKLFLDTAGVALAGSSAAGVTDTLRLLNRWGGRGESTVWVFGDKLPSLHAVLVNGMMVHALDFDDTHGKVAIHAGASVIPTALAIAEADKGINGRDLITAVVIGVEVASKLGLSIIEQDKGWHLSAVCGTFAAAAVAGKLLGLDRRKLGNALGIAYAQTSGNLQSQLDGSLTKRMQPGLSARSGVMSALLAQEGITGPDRFLDGQYGFFPLYEANLYEPRFIAEGLGAPFEVPSLAIKPYPCCRLVHSPLDALFKIMKTTDLKLDDIEAIDVYGSQAMKTLSGNPFEVGVSSSIDAQFSLAYIMVKAITSKVINARSFAPELIRDPALAPQVAKVHAIVSSDIRDRFASRVEIKLKNGGMLTESVAIPKGQPETPLDWDECVEKFRCCAADAERPLDPVRVERFVLGLQRLEEFESAADIVQHLV